MPKKKAKSIDKLIISLSSVGVVGAILLAVRLEETDSSRFAFLYWNLILAVLPALLAWYLVYRLKNNRWLHPKQLLLTVGWLIFLPNSFYLVTDFIHLSPTHETGLLYDIFLITSFAIAGLIFGFTSLYLVHSQLVKRLSPRHSWYLVIGVLTLCSFAIYLGRFSRWNTWDLLLAPAGLLFDVSDRLVNPASHTETYIVSLTVFALLLSTYWAIWEAAEYLRK